MAAEAPAPVTPDGSPSTPYPPTEQTELQAVEALRALFDTSIDNLTCLRFLRANDRHVKRAARQYRTFLAWRARERIDEVRTEPLHPPAIEEELQRVSMRLIDGYDLQGRPVMAAALGKIDIHELKKQGITVPMMTRRHARAMEELVERITSAPDPRAGHLLIFDLAGCTLSKFFWAWPYIREVAHMGQAYYPELLGKLCFVKGPERAFWAIDKVKLLLNPETRAKVSLSSGDVLPLLHAHLPPETSLPADLGIATWPPEEKLDVVTAEATAPDAVAAPAAEPTKASGRSSGSKRDSASGRPSHNSSSVRPSSDWSVRPSSSTIAPAAAGDVLPPAPAPAPAPALAPAAASAEATEALAAPPALTVEMSFDGVTLAGDERRVVSPSKLPRPPLPDEWPSRPMLLRVASGTEATPPGAFVGFNDPASVFALESDYFSGRCYVRLRGLPAEPSAYFTGKRRSMSTVVQGRVKQPLPMRELSTGFEFNHPLLHLPGKTIIRLCTSIVRTIAPAVTIDLLSNSPCILNPLFDAVQRLHVALPGDEPEITTPFEEETELLGGVFAERPVAWKERKKLFTSRSSENDVATYGRPYMLDPAHVITMEFYEDKLIPAAFELLIGPMRFSLARLLGGGTPVPQPLMTMAQVGFEPHSRCYLFNVELWHDSLFAEDEEPKSTGTRTPLLGSFSKGSSREPLPADVPVVSMPGKTPLVSTDIVDNRRKRGWMSSWGWKSDSVRSSGASPGASPKLRLGVPLGKKKSAARLPNPQKV